MKYRIKWYAPTTNKSGHGTGEYSKEKAQQIADAYNAADTVEVVHTIEAVPAKDKAEQRKSPGCTPG